MGYGRGLNCVFCVTRISVRLLTHMKQETWFPFRHRIIIHKNSTSTESRETWQIIQKCRWKHRKELKF